MLYLQRGFSFLLLLGLLLCFAPSPAAAQSAITVNESLAQPDFPNTITFSLDAASSAGDITSVQLLYGAARTEALSIVELPIAARPQVSVEHVLDTQVYYSPPGTEMVFHWIIEDSAGNIFETEPSEFLYHDDRFNWSELTARNVIVYWYEGGPSFGQELIDAAVRTIDKMQPQVGSELSQPVRVYIYASNSDMRSAFQANEAEWVGGQANSQLGIIIGAIAPGNTPEVQRLIPHEISHQVLDQGTENPYGGMPFWFNEGLAVHNQEIRDADFDEMLEDAARASRLIPLEALASSFPADPDQALLSYAQSRNVVEYIIDTHGVEKLRELIDAFGDAIPTDEALQNVLGMNIDELDEAWRVDLPAAEVAPPDLSSPQEAPADRFSDDPVLPDDVAPPVSNPSGGIVDDPDAPNPIVLWFNGLPAWATLGAAALCCIVGVLAIGAALLIGLRFLGVDKQQ